MIHHVFLDIDDTLLDFHKGERRALTRSLQSMGLEVNDEILARYSVINLSQWKLLERGETTRARLLVHRFRILFAELGISADPEKMQATYEYELGLCHDFLPGARQLLSDLRERGYRLYVVSNGTTVVQTPRIKASGLDRYMDGIFLSEELGADKPSPVFFEKVFAAIPDFNPAHAIVLGDSLTSDVLGGIRAGIKTCWFDLQGRGLSGEIKPDYVIDRLSQFVHLLEKIHRKEQNATIG